MSLEMAWTEFQGTLSGMQAPRPPVKGWGGPGNLHVG